MYDLKPRTTGLQDSQPFDATAVEYDADFTRSRLGRWLREAVHCHLADLVQPGDHVLELGCGTGEDALWLARRGAQVVATDASTAMLEVAERKVAAAGFDDRISFAQLDLSEFIGDWSLGIGMTPGSQYDAVLANFGVLNCLADRRPLAGTLAHWVRPGGRVALVVMSPICPWEIAWYAAHGQLGTAVRRFRSGVEARLGNGRAPAGRVRVWYPSLRRLRTEFVPYFRPVYAAGIGVLLPPSYLSHLVDRWPQFFARLAAWEPHLAERFPWTWLNDHYLIVFERWPVNSKQ